MTAPTTMPGLALGAGATLITPGVGTTTFLGTSGSVFSSTATSFVNATGGAVVIASSGATGGNYACLPPGPCTFDTRFGLGSPGLGVFGSNGAVMYHTGAITTNAQSITIGANAISNATYTVGANAPTFSVFGTLASTSAILANNVSTRVTFYPGAVLGCSLTGTWGGFSGGASGVTV